MTTALVIGAGIAGATSALALHRAGIDALVFEAYPSRTTADVGSYFTITPNGLDVLRTLDALHLATASGIPTRQNVLWNERGRPLAAIPLGQALPDGTISQTIKRSHLGRVLQDEAIRRGTRIEFGKRLTAATERDGQVVASFADGSEAIGDVLIGADGIHSPTRRLIDPSAPAGRYLGLTNFGGYTPNAALAAAPETWHMIFGRRGFFGYLRDSAGGAVWFANVPRAPIEPAERAATSAEAWRSQLLELFSGDTGPAVDLIRRGELQLAGDNTYDLPHVPTWHRGRLIVIGDAAHAPSPSSGQGASMAMEDSLVLGQCLCETDSIREAFSAYERLRRQRVERIVAQGARSSSSKVPGPFGRLARDLMLRLLFRFVVNDAALAWMYDYRIDWQVPSSHGPARGPREDPVTVAARSEHHVGGLRPSRLDDGDSARHPGVADD